MRYGKESLDRVARFVARDHAKSIMVKRISNVEWLLQLQRAADIDADHVALIVHYVDCESRKVYETYVAI